MVLSYDALLQLSPGILALQVAVSPHGLTCFFLNSIQMKVLLVAKATPTDGEFVLIFYTFFANLYLSLDPVMSRNLSYGYLITFVQVLWRLHCLSYPFRACAELEKCFDCMRAV